MYNYKAVLATMFVFLTIIAIVCAVVGIVMYIFQAIGMYSISKRRKLGTSAFAWIPILNMFKLGQIADDAVLHKRGTRSHFMILMPVFSIAGGVLYGVGYFLFLVSFDLGSGELSRLLINGLEEIPALIRSGRAARESLVAGIILIAIGYLFMLIASVLEFICLYHIFKSCVENYVLFFIFSLIFIVTIPFFLYAVRQKDNVEFYRNPIPGSVATE